MKNDTWLSKNLRIFLKRRIAENIQHLTQSTEYLTSKKLNPLPSKLTVRPN